MLNDNKPNHFLLAYDGSEHSRAAVSLLCDLGGWIGINQRSSVKLLTVFTPRQIISHDYLNQSLKEAQLCLEKTGLFDVSAELVLGYPAEKILEYTENEPPDMILLGAKGLRSTLGILLGGVAQHVVEYSCCPVLVARAPYNGLKNILLVTDGSLYSQNALEHLKALHMPDETQITIMHVLPPAPIQPIPKTITETWPVGPESFEIIRSTITSSTEETAWLQQEEQEGEALLSKVTEELKSSGIKAFRVLLRGDAATEIIGFAQSNNTDLIISGSRGLSQLRGILLGSVSRKLVHYASSSVLIVKNPQQSKYQI